MARNQRGGTLSAPYRPGMDKRRPRPLAVDDLAHQTRVQLMRYFAWGYLSRRELNQRLNGSMQTFHHLRRTQALHSAA
jgi:hypothetical protein